MLPLGKEQNIVLQVDQRAALDNYLEAKGKPPFTSHRIGSYYRVEKEGQTFFSALYTRVQRRNSHTVAYGDESEEEKYGCIQLFLNFQGALLALLKPLEVARNHCHQLLSSPIGTDQSAIKDTLDEHILAIDDTFTMAMECEDINALKVVELSSVRRKCVLVEIDKVKYVSTIPNIFESD